MIPLMLAVPVLSGTAGGNGTHPRVAPGALLLVTIILLAARWLIPRFLAEMARTRPGASSSYGRHPVVTTTSCRPETGDSPLREVTNRLAGLAPLERLPPGMAGRRFGCR